MNIVTRALLEKSRDPKIKRFVEAWDAVEALVLRVYRAGAAGEDDEREFQALKTKLEQEYPNWQAALDPYWRKATINGVPAGEDPFLKTLSTRRAADFAGDWAAVQQLPPAREAVNQYLLDRFG